MSDVATIAESLIGKVKYVFGADNISLNGGTGDCSAFTQFAFKQCGINIGRTTSSQYQKGTSVLKEDIQRGDLVFFRDTYASGYEDGVSHVGIAVSNTEFVHNSSGAGGVVKSKLNSAYYQSHYLAAKRITSNSNNIINLSSKDNESSESVDLKWYGDLIVLILTIIVIASGFLFFMMAFDFSNINPLKGV